MKTKKIHQIATAITEQKVIASYHEKQQYKRRKNKKTGKFEKIKLTEEELEAKIFTKDKDDNKIFTKEALKRFQEFYPAIEKQVAFETIIFDFEEDMQQPYYATDQSAGFDLEARNILQIGKKYEELIISSSGFLFWKKHKLVTQKLQVDVEKQRIVWEREGYIDILPKQTVIFGTGMKIGLPIGKFGAIVPKSGLSYRQDFLIKNSPGTVDSDFENEVGVILFNPTNFPIRISRKQYIGQFIIESYTKAPLSREKTQTRKGGFDSTGKGDVTKENTSMKKV